MDLISRWFTCTAIVLLLSSIERPAAAQNVADDHGVKPPIRGLVSMGAFKFVGSGGDPVKQSRRA
jgi:hypothetical protein